MPPAREGYGRAYPGPVGGRNLVCLFCFYGTLSSFGTVLPRQWPLVSLVDTGPSQDLALWSKWPGRVHGKGRVLSEYFGPPEWEYGARYSVVWVKCATSVECI